MSSAYLSGADLSNYGVANASASDIRKASGLIDTYLNRSEGLVWAPDSLGRPAYMTALDPTMVFTLSAPITPGKSVVIAFPYATYDLIGEVFILDRAVSGACEPVTVIAVDPNNGTATLARVLKPHAAGALLEAGLVILEERPMPAKRSIARISRPNLTALISAVGRYGYGRRSDQFEGLINEMNLLATLQTLGGEQIWQPIDVASVSISAVTGECWITPGLMLAYFSEVRLRYVAGYPVAGIPSTIKQATANVINNLSTADETNPVYKVVQAGGTRLERFDDTYIDGDTHSMLSSYKTRKFA